MPYHFHTERLTLRPLAKEDFPFIRSLHLNDEIMKHISSGPPRTEAQSLVAFERSLQFEIEDARLGSWIVELKPNLNPIGTLIMRPPATKEKMDGLEIGYSIVPEHWSKGYAQESVRAMVSYAYEHFGPIRIVALIEPEHTASRNVLEKTGFISAGMTDFVDATNGQVHSSEVLEIPRR